MSGFLFKEAQNVRVHVAALIALHPELQDDAELLADTLDGETDFNRILAKLLDYTLDAKGMKEAVKARRDENDDRMKRYERQEHGGRKLIQTLMESAGQDKVTLPEATLSITAARTSVNVTNIDDLPQGFFKTERKPLSKEIKTALEKGECIPGAELVMGECGLMVRTK